MPLCFSRHVGEDVVLSKGGKVIGTIRVTEIRGDKVRLAFNFPKNIRVDRDEMQDTKGIEDGNATSSVGSPA